VALSEPGALVDLADRAVRVRDHILEHQPSRPLLRRDHRALHPRQCRRDRRRPRTRHHRQRTYSTLRHRAINHSRSFASSYPLKIRHLDLVPLEPRIGGPLDRGHPVAPLGIRHDQPVRTADRTSHTHAAQPNRRIRPDRQLTARPTAALNYPKINPRRVSSLSLLDPYITVRLTGPPGPC